MKLIKNLFIYFKALIDDILCIVSAVKQLITSKIKCFIYIIYVCVYC